ncbi:SET domain-containing protein 4 [Teratosphaeria destructans]|uniref:SET domain-containing protein 4 n=1 Tax=Teratosphaeria destructans TaxID=418781 RepID=A0A9W7SI86_9PEZI|nr:SET domain-containing protein 4 [Teratosphaeria destructans]
MAAGDGIPDDAISLQRFAPLYLVLNTPKGMIIRPFLNGHKAKHSVGRGVFAGAPMPSGTIIDGCPVLILDPKENTNHIEKTSLYHYTYNWPIIARSPDRPTKIVGKTQAVIFGLGSMFNHSKLHQNVGWTRDLRNDMVIYRALRDIEKSEELLISYGNALTFVDADAPSKEEMDEDMAKEAEQILSSISLD